MNEDLEETHLQAWKERNKIAEEIKAFIEDKRWMEKDMRDKKREIDEAKMDLEDERNDLEKERDELEKYEKELEKMRDDLEDRERRLILDREDFADLKKKFIEGIMKSGSYEMMTPEMKKMAKSMGVDIDDLIDEARRIKERKDQLEKLKKENDDQL